MPPSIPPTDEPTKIAERLPIDLPRWVGLVRILPWRRLLRWLIVLLFIYGVCRLLLTAGTALTPFYIGFVFAYLLLPIVNRLHRHMPRWAAILLTYVCAFITIGGFFTFLVPPLIKQVTDLIQFIPTTGELQTRFVQITEFYQKTIVSIPVEVRTPLENTVQEALTALQNNLTSLAQGFGSVVFRGVLQVINTVSFLFGFLLIPFWLFYVLMDTQAGLTAFDRMLHPRVRADFWALIQIFDLVVSRYLRGQLFLGFIVGSAAGIGLLVLGLFGFKVEFILVLAVIAGFTELIPVIGPVVGAVPAILLGLIDSPQTAVAVLVLYIIIQQLENHLLVPRIVGDSVGIHSALLMILLIAFSQVYGLAGAILAAPLSAVVRDIFLYGYGRLSDQPTPAGQLPTRLQRLANPPAPTPPPATPKKPPQQREQQK